MEESKAVESSSGAPREPDEQPSTVTATPAPMEVSSASIEAKPNPSSAAPAPESSKEPHPGLVEAEAQLQVLLTTPQQLTDCSQHPDCAAQIANLLVNLPFPLCTVFTASSPPFQ